MYTALRCETIVSMRKIVFSFFVLVFLCTLTTNLFAATPRPTESFTDETFVYNLSITGNTYSPGKEVQGKFTILNASETYLDNIQYLIYVAGNIDANFNHNTFGKVYSPSFGLDGKAPKEISFSYNLPKVLPSGAKELVIRSLHNGVPYGNMHIPIDVEQGIQPLGVAFARITVMNKQFPIANGPTLYPNRPGIFLVRFYPDKDKDITINPEVKLYKDNADTGELLFEKNLPNFIVKLDSNEFAYNLPTDYPSGIYEAVFTMKDENENVRRRMVAHYIIGGAIATVRSVSFPEKTAIKNGVINVTSEITGNPDDIVINKISAQIKVSVKTTIKNQNGRVIGEVAEEKEVKDKEIIKTPVQIKKDAQEFEVTVEVYDANSKLLSTLSRASSREFYRPSFFVKLFNSPLGIMGGLIVLMISILAIIRLMFGKKSFLFSFLLVIAIVPFLGSVGNAEASTSIIISTPVPYQVITAGAPFFVEGSVTVNQCRNAAAYYTLSHSGIRESVSYFDMDTDPFQVHIYEKKLWSDDDGTRHDFQDVTENFSIGLVAPSTPGHYFICIGERDWRTDETTGVLNSTPTVNCRDFVVVDNPCGSAIDTISTSTPSTGLCKSSYSASSVTSNDTTGVHSWSCSSGASDTQCHVNYCRWRKAWDGTSCIDETRRPQCGTAATDGVPIKMPPTKNLCAVGRSGSVQSTSNSYSNYSSSEGTNNGPQYNDQVIEDDVPYIRSLHGWMCGLGNQATSCAIPRCPVETPTWSGNSCVKENPTVQCGEASRSTVPIPIFMYTNNLCDGFGYGSQPFATSSSDGSPVWEWECISANLYLRQNNVSCVSPREANHSGIDCWATADEDGNSGTADGSCALVQVCESEVDLHNFSINNYNPCLDADVSNKKVNGGKYSWDCTRGGLTISCSVAPKIDGECPQYSGPAGTGPFNTCESGTVVTNYPPNDDDDLVVWSCFGINGGSDNTSCKMTCPTGQKVVGGVCATPEVIGKCSTNKNECFTGTPISGVPVDTATESRWTCRGSNDNSSADDEICRIPATTPECTLQINTTLNTKVTNSPVGKCSVSWSAQNVYAGSGSDTCNNDNISCTFDGTLLSGTTFTNQQINLGSHTVVCTDSVMKQTTTLNPRLQCRLNPSYAEF